jgi:hypothetical protein
LRIRSILATDVPPNFITRRPMTARETLELRISIPTSAKAEARWPKRAYT